MAKKQPRIYTYKITFEEVPHYYYGFHKEKKFGEEYWGSPVTHKWMWDFYTPKKQVLELFDFNDEGYKEAIEVEKRLIRPVFNTDPLCLNENCGAVPSLSARGRGGLTNKRNGTGIFKLTEEERRENCRKGTRTQKEKSIGIFNLTPEERSQAGKKGGKKSAQTNMKNGTAIFALTKEELSENGKKGGKIGGKIGSKNTNSQKWQCTETGYVTNAGALTWYQRKRGIDTKNRIRIE
jgi:general stress protein YciG